MRLICPHCGLKGTAEVALLAKKIRCPQCRKISRLDETIIVPAAIRPDDLTGCPGVSEMEGKLSAAQSLQREIQASRIEPGPRSATAPGVGICSVCGFSLSYSYLEERAARLFCRICLPA